MDKFWMKLAQEKIESLENVIEIYKHALDDEKDKSRQLYNELNNAKNKINSLENDLREIKNSQ